MACMYRTYAQFDSAHTMAMNPPPTDEQQAVAMVLGFVEQMLYLLFLGVVKLCSVLYSRLQEHRDRRSAVTHTNAIPGIPNTPPPPTMLAPNPDGPPPPIAPIDGEELPRKWYVVSVGRVPGIYDDWDAAGEQVVGVSGNRCKHYRSLNAATRAWEDAVSGGRNVRRDRRHSSRHRYWLLKALGNASSRFDNILYILYSVCKSDKRSNSRSEYPEVDVCQQQQAGFERCLYELESRRALPIESSAMSIPRYMTVKNGVSLKLLAIASPFARGSP
ncbi:hypothetical protein SISNIDRAFT_466038 [Sistotremastrum niveocremeum HHB9708]|uniref:Ribonuclease H1 N-terminal domain-containing protein n=1 Tax=Sistotremastrum niveocremeum HHB9708 TaxID=1314777 RepID=A0A164V7G3_9AGAM|nr:hypothetical protein SISNIDRAFT_466038 [Sistotremastrum niveocremeum HHB9708]